MMEDNTVNRHSVRRSLRFWRSETHLLIEQLSKPASIEFGERHKLDRVERLEDLWKIAARRVGMSERRFASTESGSLDSG